MSASQQHRRWLISVGLVLAAVLLGWWWAQSASRAGYPPVGAWVSSQWIQRPLTESFVTFQSLWISLYRSTAPLLNALPFILAGVLCLMLLFRLSSHLFGRAAGVLAVWLLATLGLPGAADLGLPYIALVAITLALHLAFVNGYKHQRRLGIGYFLLVVVAVYSYTPLIYIIIAHLVWVWKHPVFERKTLGFYGVLGLVLLPRLVFLPAELAFWRDVVAAETFLPVFPAFFHLIQYAALLGLAGVNLLAEDDAWVQYLLLVGMMAFVIHLLLPASLIVNLLTIIPLLTLLAARGLLFLPYPIRIGVALLVAAPLLLPGAISLWGANREPAATVTIPMDNRVVFAASAAWQHILMADQLRSTAALIPPANQFHLMNADQRDDTVSGQTARTADAAMLDNFTAFVGDAPAVWWMEMDSLPTAAAFRTQLETQYSPFAVWRWLALASSPNPALMLTRYLRFPENLNDIYIYGDQAALLNWRLLADVVVQPCQAVTFESWWRVTQPAVETLSMTLVLADSNGQGVARTDRMPGYIETQLWQMERPYPDQRVLMIPCDITPGEYPLLVGVYRLSDSSPQNLPVALPDGTPVGELAYLTTLIVP